MSFFGKIIKFQEIINIINALSGQKSLEDSLNGIINRIIILKEI